MQFYKADVTKDDKEFWKRPIVSGSKDHIEPKSILKIIFTKEEFESAACHYDIQNEKNTEYN